MKGAIVKAAVCTLVWVVVHWTLPVEASNLALESREQMKVFAHQAESAQQSALIKRESFLMQSSLSQVILSPDGNSIAYAVKQTRHFQIWRYDISQNKHIKLLSTKFIEQLYWSTDSQSVYLLAPDKLIKVDVSTPNLAHHLYDFNHEETDFFGLDQNVSGVFWLSQYHGKKNLHQLIRIDNEGNKDVVLTSKLPLASILTNADGQVSVIKRLSENGVVIEQFQDGEFTPLLACELLDPCRLHHWDPVTQNLLVSAYFESELLSLYQINVKESNRILVSEDPQQRFDISSVEMDKQGNPVLTRFQDDYLSLVGFTPAVKHIVTTVEQRFSTPLLNLQLARNTMDNWLVEVRKITTTAREFWLYSNKNQSWHRPFSHLTTNTMSSEQPVMRKPFWFTASDGMKIHGYLTLPTGRILSKTPLVVSPHGGPWNRSNGSLNGMSHFLANRGYIVIEPNFRASTGLGKSYMFGANKDFGDGRVQQDILDAVDYILANGIGDKEQLAIVGHSFGGFSTLTALAFSPDKFKVGFAGAAPSNLSHTLVRYHQKMTAAQKQRNQARFKHLMVDMTNTKDVKRLFDKSPDSQWQKINKPLYMWAGERDPRVAIEDIRDFSLRLRDKNKPVTLLSAPDEGHSPRADLAREAYLYMIENALHRYLSGEIQHSMSQRLTRYLEKNLVIEQE